jgi:hypothetical protein
MPVTSEENPFCMLRDCRNVCPVMSIEMAKMSCRFRPHEVAPCVRANYTAERDFAMSLMSIAKACSSPRRAAPKLTYAIATGLGPHSPKVQRGGWSNGFPS